jgi:hypothetical protein
MVRAIAQSRRSPLRGIAVVAVVLALMAPQLAVEPASAIVLFTCPSLSSASYAEFQPGLGHTRAAQTAVIYLESDSSAPCDNGQTFSGPAGDTSSGQGAITTYGTRPLGCPTGWGGAGPDYADQTPILLGAATNTFILGWTSPLGGSNGTAKVKQGTAGDRWRIVYNITDGKYRPPAGQKTKIKGQLTYLPTPGPSYTCLDDSDPLVRVTLTNVAPLVVSQK